MFSASPIDGDKLVRNLLLLQNDEHYLSIGKSGDTVDFEDHFPAKKFAGKE